MRISVRAHAKINWSLSILGLLPDGYHELDMLMQSLELSDELIFEPARWLSLTVNGQSLPVGGRNLIIRAANALNEAVGERHGARIQLMKHIPIRAGLGGGSADCAVTLLTLNLGADVPFCMLGGLARVGGVGEKLSPISGAPSIPLAMVTPGGGLSTPAVFKAWDEGSYPIVPVDMPALSDALIRGDLDAAQSLSYNSLEAPAIGLMPEIGEIIDKFHALGARMVRMTGSGSTVFAAFDTDEQAKAAASQIPGAIATRTQGSNA